MIHYVLGLCIVSSSWILLFTLSRRLLHSCLWKQQHLFLLIPAFNPSNPPTVPWFTSYIPLSGFQNSSPTFSFNSYCFPILCKDQTHHFPASSTVSYSHFFLCSVAWKAQSPCTLCGKAVYRHLQDFPCHQTSWTACSRFSADFTNGLRCSGEYNSPPPERLRIRYFSSIPKGKCVFDVSDGCLCSGICMSATRLLWHDKKKKN